MMAETCETFAMRFCSSSKALRLQRSDLWDLIK